MDFVLTTEAIREGFENLKPSSNYDNYILCRIQSHWDWLDECNPLVYRKTWWIQTSTVCGRVQTPTLAMVVDRLLQSRILNRNPIGSYRLYIETFF
jgi:DNA topoisomerase-3